MSKIKQIKCPRCGSTHIFKDGFRDDLPNVQRYRCADYGHRFSKHFPRQKINLPSANIDRRQVCVSILQETTKNLDSTQENKLAHGKVHHTPTENEIKAGPQIKKLLAQLENDGRTAGTVKNYRMMLARLLNYGADLFDPENTKQVLAKADMAKNAKRGAAAMLNTWYDFLGVHWKRPRYAREHKIPHIPTEKTLDTLISALGKKTATYCQLLKETGARCGEISALTWDSIDFEQKTVNIVAGKDSNPRLLILSQKAIGMIANLKLKKKHR